ncbi:MAG TPA: Ig-like domain-containing protein [Ignavibacteriaceae bacterium]|nr:Ig-like domain-containing protein [Ignavibacteriaceae bacterium]
MKSEIKKYHLFILILMLVSIFNFLGCDKSTDYSGSNFRVSFDSPTNNSVFEDSISIKFSLQNINAVEQIDFYVNEAKVLTKTKGINGFDFKWKPNNPQSGESYVLKAVSKDRDGNVANSMRVKVGYKWLEIINDKNEAWEKNVKTVFVRNSSTQLHFRADTYTPWVAPYSTSGGISFGIFLDTDTDASTGLRSSITNFGYTLNHIGADYLAIVGLENNKLYRWSESTTSWVPKGNLTYLVLQNNSSTLQFGINKGDFGNPTSIRFVALMLTPVPSLSMNWDWAPDNGFADYTLDKTFSGRIDSTGNSNIPIHSNDLFLLKKIGE